MQAFYFILFFLASILYHLAWYVILPKVGEEGSWNRGLLLMGWDLDFFLDNYLGLVKTAVNMYLLSL